MMMKQIKSLEEFLNEQQEYVDESTINQFKPSELGKDRINPKLFAKLMPKTSKTSAEAEKRIFTFAEKMMWVHYQYFEVQPINDPNGPKYRIHNSQYWLTGKGVNVTLLTVKDITDPGNDKPIGRIYVDTEVYLEEQPKVFKILKYSS